MLLKKNTVKKMGITKNKNLIDVCTCGHYKKEHLPSAVAQGHGACGIPTCGCMKFTWAKFEERMGMEEVLLRR